jgi:hypothetical protein
MGRRGWRGFERARKRGVHFFRGLPTDR